MKMIYRIYLFLHLSVVFVKINAQASQGYYIGAVVEYAPIHNESLSPGGNIQININEYENYIKQAKDKGADIILFPECGLTTTIFAHDLELYTSILPDPKKEIIACGTNSSSWTKVIQRLSCAAKNNKMYVVVNLPERMMLNSSDGEQDKKHKIFNTNIVFDRRGALIARYRKYNLFSEAKFNVTETPDLTYFQTDFDVTFGTFTCFDILFAKPSLELLKVNENITDILFPTAWHSELPFLTAIQTQVGWARANGVNFLAAGYSDPKHTDGGSVIYQAATGDITYHIPIRKETSLIIKQIKKIKKRVSPNSVDRNTASATKNIIFSNSNLELVTWKENLTNYNTVLLNDTGVEDYKLCHKYEETLCCTFTVQFDSQAIVDYYYRMIVYYGPRGFSTTTHNIQVCGIAACTTNNSSNSCGERITSPSNSKIFKEISIKGEFIDQGSSVIFPSNVLYDLGVLAPSNFTYKTTKSDCYRQVEMSTTEQVKDILAFGIYSVTKDSPSPAVAESGLSGGVIAIVVIAVLIIVALIGFLIWRKFKNGNYKPANN